MKSQWKINSFCQCQEKYLVLCGFFIFDQKTKIRETACVYCSYSRHLDKLWSLLEKKTNLKNSKITKTTITPTISQNPETLRWQVSLGWMEVALYRDHRGLKQRGCKKSAGEHEPWNSVAEVPARSLFQDMRVFWGMEKGYKSCLLGSEHGPCLCLVYQQQ